MASPVYGASAFSIDPESMNPASSSSAQSTRRRERFFGRAIGASRDLFRRRDQASGFASTSIEPRAWPKPPRSPASHGRIVQLTSSEGRADQDAAAIPDLSLPADEVERENMSSFNWTRPLSPEGGRRSESMPGSRRQDPLPVKDVVSPSSSRPTNVLKKSKMTFSIPPASSTDTDVSENRPSSAQARTRSHAPTETGHRDFSRPIAQATVRFPLATAITHTHASTHRPEIPTRKESLPAERRVLQDLVDQTVRSGDFRDSRQSVTAYISAEYSSDLKNSYDLTHASTLSMTSWLSDPDGPLDDLVSWNQPVTSRRDSVTATTSLPSSVRSQRNTSLLNPPRPTLAHRSQSSPIYSNATAPQEPSDAQYDRILREKLRHHAGQVKKRLETSTYYSPTVRQGEIEVHLAFVRAAEEILKQSPIWHGSSQVGNSGGMEKEERIGWLLRV